MAARPKVLRDGLVEYPLVDAADPRALSFGEIEAAREKYLARRETLTVTSLGDYREAMKQARDEENEACALVADALAAQWSYDGTISGDASIVADAIRARRKAPIAPRPPQA